MITLAATASAIALVSCGQSEEFVRERSVQEAVDQCFAERKLYVHGTIKDVGRDVVVTSHCVTPDRREDLQSMADKLVHPIKEEGPDFDFVAANDLSTQFYFSKPGNPAYPWAIRIFVLQPDSAFPPGTPRIRRLRTNIAVPNNTPMPATAAIARAVTDWVDRIWILGKQRLLDADAAKLQEPLKKPKP
jgi:hypothetical protein